MSEIHAVSVSDWSKGKKVNSTYSGSHLDHIALRPGVEVRHNLGHWLWPVSAYFHLLVNHPECVDVTISGALV
jgi:hypothetical protein